MAFQIILTVLFALGTISTIVLIGQPRDPIAPKHAAVTLIANAIIIYGLWNWI